MRCCFLCVALGVVLVGAFACDEETKTTADSATPEAGVPDLAVEAPSSVCQATTASGPVIGVEGAKSCAYLGIPYAKPPVDALRWKPPEKHAPWTETFLADSYGDACPQHELGYAKWKAGRAFSEDCLYLNVWTPDMKPPKPAPVLVWIHKGYWNLSGSSITAWTDGTNMAEMEGLVVVSFHYRLRALGFLAHPALGVDSGNYGFLDQVAALSWIRDNIAAFGGDPDNVTIMGGGSQGAEMVYVHLVSQKSKGLFHRAIIHSGKTAQNLPPDGLFAAGPYFTRADANAQGQMLAASTEVKCDGAADVAKCLRGKTPEELNGALASFLGVPKSGADAFWGPIVEPGGVLEAVPLALIKSGKLVNKVPVLLGTNRHEAGGGSFGPNVLTAQELSDRYELLFGGSDAAAILQQYPPATYTPISTVCDSKCSAVTDLGTDYYFVCPARRIARALTGQGVDTYLYHLTYPHYPIYDGPGHGSIKIYVFYTPQDTPPSAGWPAWPFAPDEDAMAKEIMAYWARFARTGDPNGGSAVKWPKYEASTDKHLQLDKTISEGSGLREAYCDFLDSLSANPP